MQCYHRYRNYKRRIPKRKQIQKKEIFNRKVSKIQSELATVLKIKLLVKKCISVYNMLFKSKTSDCKDTTHLHMSFV